MTKLSVNVNKIAVIRNSRGGTMPDVVRAAMDIERFGADGITVHPRPDERHIRYADVYALRPVVQGEFNIEGNPDDRFVALVLDVRPEQVTLVPDAHDVITSNAGWDTVANSEFLRRRVEQFHQRGIRVSIFVEPDVAAVRGAFEVGADRIELYTESYARLYGVNREQAIVPYVAAAYAAQQLGLGVNAGHDLSLENLNYFVSRIPYVDEVSIGHALISDALYFGLERTIKMYRECL